MPGSKPLWMDLIRGARKWWEPKIRARLSQNPWSISILDVNVRTPLALNLTHAGVCKNPLRHVQTEFQTMYLSKCCLTSFHDWMSICEQILTRNVRTDFKNSFSCIIESYLKDPSCDRHFSMTVTIYYMTSDSSLISLLCLKTLFFK